MRAIVSLLMFVIATWVFVPNLVLAGSGFYISSDLGANFSQGVEFEGATNDVASHCDALTNPGLTGCNPKDFQYTGDFVPDWWTDFDGGQGILAGAAVGYGFADQYPNSPLSGFRVELEYFYRESKHDQTVKVGRASGATLQKINRGEFGTGPFERLDSLTSHNLFGNLFYDFINTSRFTPYIGVGGGVGFTEADYSSNWTRTADEAKLKEGLEADSPSRHDLAANDAYITNLAGSSSNAQTTLSDTLYGLQVLFGVDYAFTEAMSLGLKGRWVKFSSFRDNLIWDPLRSHDPYVGKDGKNPVSGDMKTSDIEFFGVSLNLKYHF